VADAVEKGTFDDIIIAAMELFNLVADMAEEHAENAFIGKALLSFAAECASLVEIAKKKAIEAKGRTE